MLQYLMTFKVPIRLKVESQRKATGNGKLSMWNI